MGTADVESISEPGQKSVVSETFDKYATAEEVFDAFLLWLRESRSPVDGSAPKSLEVSESSDTEFTTIATWNGTLTRAAGRIYTIQNVPKTGDYVTKRQVTFDRATLTIVDENFAGSAADLMYLMKSTTTIHKAPAMIEWCAVDDKGLRHFDAAAAKSVQSVVNNVFSHISKSRAQSGGA